MLIGLKGANYYSKVFKRVNYKLSNSTFRVVITPPPDDTERASLSGSTPSGFPKEEAHGTCEHHTPDDSISYSDMLSRSLTKVSKPCYVIPTACHNPRSVALRWCVRTPCSDIFCRDSKELSSISDCFGDQFTNKNTKT